MSTRSIQFMLGFALFCLSPLLHAEDELAVKIGSRAVVSHHWRKDEWFKLFKCWGGYGDDQAWIDKESGITQTFTEANGESAKAYTGDRKPGFMPFVPQHLRWTNTLTKDRNLSVTFHQAVKRSQSTTIDDVCSSESFDSKLDSLDNSVESKLTIHIPNDIHVLRIKKTFDQLQAQTANPVSTGITNSENIEQEAPKNVYANYTSDVKTLTLDVGQYQYMLVQPNTDVSFKVNWHTSELNDSGFRVDFEIRLLGIDECSKYFGTAAKGFKPELVGALANALDPKTMQQDPHAYMEKIACLSGPDYIQSLLYSNHGHDLVAALKKSAEKLDLEVPSIPDYQRSYNPVWTITQMTLFQISRTLLKDLAAYCSPSEIKALLGLPDSFKLKVNGYAYAARTYRSIQLLLDVPPFDLADYYLKLLQTFSDKNLTYATTLADPNNIAVITQYYNSLDSRAFLIYPALRDDLMSLPATNSGSQIRNDIFARIDEEERASNEWYRELKQSFLNFQNRIPTVVSTATLKNRLDTLRAKHRATVSALTEDLGWFVNSDGSLGEIQSAFLKDLATLNSDILDSSFSLLRNFDEDKLSHPDPTRDFLHIQETLDLQKTAMQCQQRVQ